MATKNNKKNTYPVRELGADDTFDILGILASAGAGDQVGTAVGLAIRGFSAGNTDVTTQAAATAIIDGLHGALRDPSVRDEVREFIYSVWDPKFSLGEGETYADKKREAWRKLSPRAPLDILNAMRKTDGFSDFLAFFTDMLPEASTETSSGDGSTSSSETTDTPTEKS